MAVGISHDDAMAKGPSKGSAKSSINQNTTGPPVSSAPWLLGLVRNAPMVVITAVLILSFGTGFGPLTSLFSSPNALSPHVTVRNGTYEGIHNPHFNQDFFLGIPYAQDTSGQNRFRAPQSLNTTWRGRRDAKQYSHACPGDTPDGDDFYGMSENCLSINIVRPHRQRSPFQPALPVLLYIHGGAYQIGTSGWHRYNLSYIVEHSVKMGRPIIAATINYRKGGWGFLYSLEIQGTGNTNIALRDMRHALSWVQENIAAFGGDPKRVTVWGESAGSFAVAQLMMSYGGRTDNLFHRSIQQSGSAATAWYNGTEWYQPIYDNLVSKTGCTDAPDTLSCLRTIPYETLYPLLIASKFYPVVDGDLIPAYPTSLLHSGRFAHIPHILGTNSDEGTDNAPVGLETTSDLRHYLTHSGFSYPPFVVDSILDLYPDDPALGIPLNTGPERFAERGNQYKRAAAIVGDIFYHAPRLDDARHYAKHQKNTYVFRFNTRGWVPPPPSTTANFSVGSSCAGKALHDCGMLAPAWEGVAHATELAFVFGNPRWLGPWPENVKLSEMMMGLWINFVHDGTPDRKGEVWPEYGSREKGANLVLQTEEQGGLAVEDDTYRLEARELLTKWARRRHV